LRKPPAGAVRLHRGTRNKPASRFPGCEPAARDNVGRLDEGLQDQPFWLSEGGVELRDNFIKASYGDEYKAQVRVGLDRIRRQREESLVLADGQSQIPALLGVERVLKELFRARPCAAAGQVRPTINRSAKGASLRIENREDGKAGSGSEFRVRATRQRGNAFVCFRSAITAALKLCRARLFGKRFGPRLFDVETSRRHLTGETRRYALWV